jgi:putative ABC transport system ATP-binding protein
MLEVSNLVAGYGGKRVVRLPSLSVERGACRLLLGPSGSGKSTVLLALAGLATSMAGTVTINGIELSRLKPADRDRSRGRMIGFIFQDLHLIPGLSALDNVVLSPFAAGVVQDRARAQSLLEALGLGDKVRQQAARLSRGEAQRVAIARAMLLKPSLILADEPTASLDDPACGVVADLLERAAAETGAALVIATHDSRLKARFPLTTDVEPLHE